MNCFDGVFRVHVMVIGCWIAAGKIRTAVGMPVRFVWTNGEFQTDFVSAFDRLQVCFCVSHCSFSDTVIVSSSICADTGVGCCEPEEETVCDVHRCV